MAHVRGEIELVNRVLVIRRIHVHYRLRAPEAVRETVDRVHRIHAEHCPVYQSIHKAIEITTDYELEVE